MNQNPVYYGNIPSMIIGPPLLGGIQNDDKNKYSNSMQHLPNIFQSTIDFTNSFQNPINPFVENEKTIENKLINNSNTISDNFLSQNNNLKRLKSNSFEDVFLENSNTDTQNSPSNIIIENIISKSSSFSSGSKLATTDKNHLKSKKSSVDLSSSDNQVILSRKTGSSSNDLHTSKDSNELNTNDNVSSDKRKARTVSSKTSKRNKAKKLIKHSKSSENNNMNEASIIAISKSNFDTEKSNRSNTNNSKLVNGKEKRTKKSFIATEVEKEKLARNSNPPPVTTATTTTDSKDRRKDKRYNSSSVNINKSTSNSNTSDVTALVKTVNENFETEKENFVDKEESFATLLRRKECISHKVKIVDNQYSLIRACPPSIVKSHMTNYHPTDDNTTMNSNYVTVPNQTTANYGRNKTYRDYLLDEMQWMAIDFRQELRLKLELCKSIANAVSCSSSKCSQNIVTRSFNRPYVSKFGLKAMEPAPDSSLDGSRTALKLSNSILKHWNDYESGIVGSCVNDDIFQYLYNKRDLGINSEFLGKKETNSELSLSENSLNKEIERVLSFNSIFSISASLEQSHTNSKLDTNKEEMTSREVDCNTNGSFKLYLHQRKVLENVLVLNKAGLGVFVFGDSYLGKTFLSCTLLQQWLVNASDGESGDRPVLDDKKPSIKKKVVLLVVSQNSLFRWISELQSHQLYFPFELWNANIDCNIFDKHQSLIIIVTFENLNCFLTSELFTDIVLGENADDIILKGVLVDIRCYLHCDNKQKPHLDYDFKKSLVNISFRTKSLIKNRCLISDNGYFDEDYLPLLKFLIPSNDINEWKLLSMDEDSLEDRPKSTLNGRQHYYQINSNTFYQLLLNLSLQVKFSSKADSAVSAQTREEIIPTVMGAVQSQMYNIVVQQLQKYPNLLDGECTSTLATSLILLRKVCFHSYLLTNKHLKMTEKSSIPHDNSFDNRTDINRTKSLTFDMFKNANQMHPHPNKLSKADFNMDNKVLQNEKSEHDDNQMEQVLPNTENEFSDEIVIFGPGPLSINNDLYFRNHSEILFHSLSPRIMERTSDSQATTVEGSCKLTCLIQLMKRFTGLRIVVTVETEEEFNIVNLLFNLLKIEHLQARLAFQHIMNNSSTIAEHTIDYLRKWIITQDAVKAFNAPGATSSILLATKQVFQPPSIAPQQADIVIILSESWSSYLDIKNVFRLRLLSAGPTGPPLTVVRVVASHSIEEQMARSKCSFLQFQGSLLPMITSKLIANKSSINLETDYYSVTPQKRILDRAPTFVTGVIRNSLNNTAFTKSIIFQDENAITISSPYSIDAFEAERSDTESKINILHSLAMSSKHNANRYGKGKGLIVTSKEGNTSYVKDQKTMLELGLVGARSSIINAINSLNLLRNTNTDKWLVQLQLDMIVKEQNFNRNYEILVMSNLNNTCHLSKRMKRKKIRSNNHYILINSKFLNVEEDSPQSDDTEKAITGFESHQQNNEENGDLIKKEMCDSSKNDRKIIETSKLSHKNYLQNCSNNELLSNQSLLTDFYQLLFEELNRKKIFSTKGTQFGLHLYFIKSIFNKWQFEIEKSNESKPTLQCNANLFSNIKSELSVLGKSICDIKVSKLIFPNTCLYPLSNLQQDNQKVKVENNDSFQYWPKSYMIYRQVGYECRKSGNLINNFVFVNPLQVASRTDFVNIENYHNNTNQSNIMIKYVSALQRINSKPQRKRVINNNKSNFNVLNEKCNADNDDITVEIKSSIAYNEMIEDIHPSKKICNNLGDFNNIEEIKNII